MKVLVSLMSFQFLNLENSFDGKDYVCGRILQFLMETPKCDLQSFHLLEMLLYRVHLSLFTGKYQNAVALLQVLVPDIWLLCNVFLHLSVVFPVIDKVVARFVCRHECFPPKSELEESSDEGDCLLLIFSKGRR